MLHRLLVAIDPVSGRLTGYGSIDDRAGVAKVINPATSECADLEHLLLASVGAFRFDGNQQLASAASASQIRCRPPTPRPPSCAVSTDFGTAARLSKVATLS